MAAASAVVPTDDLPEDLAGAGAAAPAQPDQSQFTPTDLDRALQAEGVTGPLADLVRREFAQETGSGKDIATSNRDAVGPLQVIPATFKRFADKGWSINDPEQSARSGIRFLKALWQKTKGDPYLTAVGYYGGEGAIPKARAGIAVSDPVNKSAPNTLEYASQVTGLPGPSQQGQVQPAVAANDRLVPADDLPSDFAQPAAVAPQAPSTADELLRQVGLTARAGVTGLTGLPAMVGDALNQGYNALIASPINQSYARLTGGPATRTVLPYLMPVSSAVQNLETRAGLPVPRPGAEQNAQAIAAAMAGAGTNALASMRAAAAVPAALPVARNVLTELGLSPGLQVGSAGTSEIARQAAQAAGAGPLGQTVAGMAGAVAPSGVIAGGAGVVRNALRGPEENIPAVQAATRALTEAGSTQPSVGQVTGTRTAQALEGLLAKTPGGAGVMAKRAEQQATEIGDRVAQLADELSPSASPSVAGRAIEKGLSGPGGFVARFKEGQTALYNRLDQYVKQDAPISVSRTKRALASLNESIPGAEALSGLFKNEKLQTIESAMRRDTAGESMAGLTTKLPDQLPYEAVKKLRTKVGDELANPSLVTDVPRAKWKALYAALSDDLDNAARATGDPAAVKAMDRANRFSRAGYSRIEDALDNVVKKGDVDKIYKAATSLTDMQAGATKIGTIMKSLRPTERDIVKSAFIRRLGQALPSQQDAEGGRFSAQTFLTNWSRMSPQAKSVMFSGQDGRLRVALEQVAKAASAIRSGVRVFSNPSGTGPAIAQLSTAGAIGSALATGRLGVAAGLLGGVAGANLTARLMTNPAFVGWLAKATRVSPAALPAALRSLQTALQGQPEDVQDDARSYVRALT